MPAKILDRVPVSCPHCGHEQPEAREAFSTICKECGQHFRVQEALKPAPKAVARAPRQRRITCFECGAELEVPASAESSMCKHCSRYLDLHDYRITTALAKNFKTKGRFVIEPKGYVFNTETVAGEVVIKGKFHGKLTAEQSLTIHTGADIKGSVAAAHLVIPAESHFRWPDKLKVGSAEIAGELVANVQATGTVTVKATGRCFGDLVAKSLVVEEGAVLVGTLRIGGKEESSKDQSPSVPPSPGPSRTGQKNSKDQTTKERIGRAEKRPAAKSRRSTEGNGGNEGGEPREEDLFNR